LLSGLILKVHIAKLQAIKLQSISEDLYFKCCSHSSCCLSPCNMQVIKNCFFLWPLLSAFQITYCYEG